MIIRILEAAEMLGCSDQPESEMLKVLQNLEVAAEVHSGRSMQLGLFEMPAYYVVSVKEVLLSVCESESTIEIGLRGWEYWRDWYRRRGIVSLRIPRRSALPVRE